jgi:1,6-anhydro-N-acetylmuramate kinase
MLIDEALRDFSGGQQHYDAGGQMVGRVHQELLATFLAHPFITQSPPKAVCGGGVYNAELMRLRRDGLAPCSVAPPETYDYPNAAREAILLTLLAYATVYGRPGNGPGATGVRRAVVRGKIVPA